MAEGVHYLDAAAPEGMRLYAIGDVHGRLDCLELMHRRIADDLARAQPADWRIIHLGDNVDRGPDARGVIEFLIEATARDERMLALMGNHDAGMLEFLAEPKPHGLLFPDNGGETTSRSYGVEADWRDADSLARNFPAFRAAVPDSHIAFLERLARFCSYGDFFFCHAGIRPGIALDAQNPRDLIWIRNEFLNHPGLHPKVVVHGHTPHSRPEVMANRVNVDTLAYETGRLTALVVEGREKWFLAAEAASSGWRW